MSNTTFNIHLIINEWVLITVINGHLQALYIAVVMRVKEELQSRCYGGEGRTVEQLLRE